MTVLLIGSKDSSFLHRLLETSTILSGNKTTQQDEKPDIPFHFETESSSSAAGVTAIAEVPRIGGATLMADTLPKVALAEMIVKCRLLRIAFAKRCAYLSATSLATVKLTRPILEHKRVNTAVGKNKRRNVGKRHQDAGSFGPSFWLVADSCNYGSDTVLWYSIRRDCDGTSKTVAARVHLTLSVDWSFSANSSLAAGDCEQGCEAKSMEKFHRDVL